MYLQHFGLKEFPFRLTPDTSYYFASSSYREAFNTLRISIENGEGFIKITGEVGTGKTLLCRTLLNTLGKGYRTVYIPNPFLTPNGLLMAIAKELDMEMPQHSELHDLVDRLGTKLMRLAQAQVRVVVCLDEVQAMPLETLEALRLLSNLETEKRKLLQVVLFGQPELDGKLNQPMIRQLRQRITFEYRLGCLASDELASYLNHRLHIAGYNGVEVFTSSSLRLLQRHAAGVPRLINILAHKALMAAYGKGLRTVSLHEMRAAVMDSQHTVMSQHRWTSAWFRFWLGCSLAQAVLFSGSR